MSKELIHIEVDHDNQQCTVEIIGNTLKIASDLANVGKNLESFKTAVLLAAKYLADEELEQQRESEAFMDEVQDILKNHKPTKN